MLDLDFAVGDRVKVVSKILSVDPYKAVETRVVSNEMVGLVINIDARLRKGATWKKAGYIVSVYVDEGLGLWEFGTDYWKIRKITE